MINFAFIAATVLALGVTSSASARERAAIEADVPPSLSMPAAIEGKVIHVDDGDTVVILDAGQIKRIIRLTDIDAPEASHGASRPGQPYSARATAYMKELALGRPAQATCYDTDVRQRDDGSQRVRYVCRILVDGVDLSMAMVDAGLAMAYRQNRRYVRHHGTYAHEDAAREARRGLWQQPHPIPPWEWRKACWQLRLCDGAAE